MNVIEYLSTLKEEDFKMNVRKAFDEYDKKHKNQCKYGYFRTKWNNKLREVGVIKQVELTVNTVELKKSNKIELVVHNYKGKDLTSLISDVIPTNTFFDKLISEGGFVRKSVDAIAARAGAGKTWSRMSLAARASIHNKEIKSALLSAEMQEHEVAKEMKKSPDLEAVDIIYLVNYFKQHVTTSEYWEILEKCFENYDILVVDSFSVIHDQLFELYEGRIKSKKLIFMITDRFTKWAEKYNCNIQLILQAKRDGTYLGSSALVHAISSLSYVQVENQSRYMEFEKNRNNGTTINRRLYFEKNDKGEIEFDIETYNATYEILADKKMDIKQFLLNKGIKKDEEISDNIEHQPESSLEVIDNFNENPMVESPEVSELNDEIAINN